MAGTGEIKDITAQCVFLMNVGKGITDGSIPILVNGPHRETILKSKDTSWTRAECNKAFLFICFFVLRLPTISLREESCAKIQSEEKKSMNVTLKCALPLREAELCSVVLITGDGLNKANETQWLLLSHSRLDWKWIHHIITLVFLHPLSWL